MTSNTLAGILFAVVLPGFVACDHDSASPTAPTGANVPSPAPPAGGLVMRGTVSDTAYRPLPRARVEVLDGAQTGLSTIADAQGQFSMSGVVDETTRFRATAEGHVTSIKTLQLFCARCNTKWWINFALEVPGSQVDMAGDYTLTFTANASCIMLPEDMRSRTFTATIPTTSSGLSADAFFRIGGATFFEDRNAIAIGVAGNYMARWLETVVEQIAPNTFLAFGGQAAGVVDNSNMSTLAVPFEGSIAHCVTTAAHGHYSDCYQGRASTRRCESRHQLTLTRQ